MHLPPPLPPLIYASLHIIIHHSEAYLPSVASTYRSSWRLNRGLKYLYGRFPDVVEKIKGPWFAMFDAAAVLALIGARKPGSQLGNAAMEELGRIESVLEQVTTKNGNNEDGTEEGIIVAEQGENPFDMLLESVRTLRQKAQEATSSESGTEELERLVGKKYFWSEHPNIPSTYPSSPSSSNSSPSLSNTGSSGTATIPSGGMTATAPLDSASHDWPLIHPTLASDIQNLDHLNMDDMRAMMDLPSPPPFQSPSPPTPNSPPKAGSQWWMRLRWRTSNGVFPLLSRFALYGLGHGFGGGFGNPSGFGLAFGGQMIMMTTATTGATGGQMHVPPLMLDSTWQSFVEQLGF